MFCPTFSLRCGITRTTFASKPELAIVLLVLDDVVEIGKHVLAVAADENIWNIIRLQGCQVAGCDFGLRFRLLSQARSLSWDP